MFISNARGFSSSDAAKRRPRWAPLMPSRSMPANRLRAGLALVILLALAVPASSVLAQQAMSPEIVAAHDQCVALARSNPKQGLEKAKLWRETGGGFAAEH